MLVIVHGRYAAFTHHSSSICHNTHYSLHMHAHMHLDAGISNVYLTNMSLALPATQ